MLVTVTVLVNEVRNDAVQCLHMCACRGQVLSTLDELRTITTHDDNLERQYKEGERDI